MNEEKLQDLFRQPAAPDFLQKKLQQNLHAQVATEQSRRSQLKWRLGLTISLVANVLFAVVIVRSVLLPNDNILMDMAYEHVQHEHDLTGNFVADQTAWLAGTGLNPQPKAYSVDLAKNCLIGLDHARHVRLVSAEQKTINLLIFPEPMTGKLPVADSGDKGTQRWLRLQSPDGIQALAFYDNTLSSQNVKQLIGTML